MLRGGCGRVPPEPTARFLRQVRRPLQCDHRIAPLLPLPLFFLCMLVAFCLIIFFDFDWFGLCCRWERDCMCGRRLLLHVPVRLRAATCRGLGLAGPILIPHLVCHLRVDDAAGEGLRLGRSPSWAVATCGRGTVWVSAFSFLDIRRALAAVSGAWFRLLRVRAR